MDNPNFGILLLSLCCLIPFLAGLSLGWLLFKKPYRSRENWRE